MTLLELIEQYGQACGNMARYPTRDCVEFRQSDACAKDTLASITAHLDAQQAVVDFARPVCPMPCPVDVDPIRWRQSGAILLSIKIDELATRLAALDKLKEG